MKFLVVLILIVVAYVKGEINWCEMEERYCSGREHIACHPNSFPMAGDNVRNIQVVEVTDELIRAGVDRHNYHRSNVASGSVEGIPSAIAMQKMAWHLDLAFVAGEHVRNAYFQHDECRYFTEFPHSGQNLAKYYSYTPYTNLTQVFETLIDLWYDEMTIVRDEKPSCIDSFTIENPNCRGTGHFTVMVNDINGFLGCGFATFEEYMSDYDYWWYTFMVTCNYQGNNIIDHPIYATGTPCSGCAAVGRQCDSETSLCV
ncbi:antigen 5 like allergen Cul n 1-like [Phlebotomus papatasi]|uniref:Uncharacterized protein n=1 Tax=Phlebotomus papatasi TaxID=29031 RepID=A0A1B0CZR0_PHLPP|nr:antigen 5 like allergen Cul n 1-like [Phlebotomus papatasi]